MQVFVTCPDWGLPAVTVTAGADSVVSYVLTAAAEEWDMDPEEVELLFAGDTLCETDRLADHGVVANSELEMAKKQFRIFGKCWFVDDAKREKLLLWMRDHITEYLCLDTPTFTEDGCLTIRGDFLLSDAKQVAFRNSNSKSTAMPSVTTIGDRFLYCSNITSLDLSSLSSVTAIGNECLSCCSRITSLDLSGFSSVTTIGSEFLCYSTRITELDLSCLSNTTAIGNYFLFSCSHITSLDLSGLSGVTRIGSHFLSNCPQITSLDLSSLRNVTSIEESFLGQCKALESVQLPESNSALFEKSVKEAIDYSAAIGRITLLL